MTNPDLAARRQLEADLQEAYRVFLRDPRRRETDEAAWEARRDWKARRRAAFARFRRALKADPAG